MQHIKNRRPQWPAIFSFSDNLIFSPFSPQTSQDMKDTPSYKRSEHIIKNIVELKENIEKFWKDAVKDNPNLYNGQDYVVDYQSISSNS